MSGRVRLGIGAGIVLILGALLFWQATDEPPVAGVTPSPSTTVIASIFAPPTTVAREIRAVESALAAWSQFAATGDVSVLDETFAPDGPQFRQLAEEASFLKAVPRSGEGRFELRAAHVRDGQDGPVVTAAIDYVTRIDNHSWCWDIHLRSAGDGFQLWTVVEIQNPRASTVSPSESGSVAPNICP